MPDGRVETIIDALAIGTTIMVSEHFFSTFLSSPLTVKTLYADKEQDRIITKIYLYEAMAISIIFGAIVSYILKDKLGIITGVATAFLYYLIYMDALGEIDLSWLHNMFMPQR
jgi:hypothetical protein